MSLASMDTREMIAALTERFGRRALADEPLARHGTVGVGGPADTRAAPDPPGGLTYDELITLLGVLLRSPLAAGMEVTVFDPELDPSGRLASEFTTALVQAFAGE